MTLDGMPYIGRYSSRTPDLFVATGFNKWGMTTAMAAAGILCDLVQDRKNPDAALFSPSRTILHPQLACNAVEAVGNLLTLRKPRCPHMGCALHWNSQEHSWDCACHGSRFTEDGALLDNPATDDLKNSRAT
jgi:Rieske Fe-S protein